MERTFRASDWASDAPSERGGASFSRTSALWPPTPAVFGGADAGKAAWPVRGRRGVSETSLLRRGAVASRARLGSPCSSAICPGGDQDASRPNDQPLVSSERVPTVEKLQVVKGEGRLCRRHKIRRQKGHTVVAAGRRAAGACPILARMGCGASKVLIRSAATDLGQTNEPNQVPTSGMCVCVPRGMTLRSSREQAQCRCDLNTVNVLVVAG